jgi:hypothetical protein
MPKIDFWDISVKSEPKSKKIFLVILFINMNKTKQKKIKKLFQKVFITKRLFLARRLPDPIESDPVVRKKKFERFGKRTV